MFFAISKLVWFVLTPLNLFALLQIFGLIALRFWKRLGQALLVLAGLVFLFCGLLPIGPYLLYQIEHYYEKPESLPDSIGGILVLGGGFNTGRYDPAHIADIPVNEAADRFLAGLALHKRYPQAQLVFSGGNGKLLKGEYTESLLAKRLAGNLGFDNQAIQYEDLSRNTYENFLYSKELVKPDTEAYWLVVTSAYHMPRAMGVGQKIGWRQLTAYPVDYHALQPDWKMLLRLDVIGNFSASNIAFHEILGIVVYKITGRMDFPVKYDDQNTD